MLGPRASVIAGSAVNTSDSYFRGTLVVDFDVTMTSDTPMYDAETGAIGMTNSGASARAYVQTAYRVATVATAAGGILSLVPGVSAIFGSVAVVAAKIAYHFHATDRWWTRITVGREAGNGFIPYPSQLYPNAIRNLRAPEPVSHSAEIDSRTSAQSIELLLAEDVGAPRRPTGPQL